MMKRNKKSNPERPQFTPPPPAPKQRHDGWTPQRRALFVEMLAGRYSVEKAAIEVGMTERAAYALRARDPDFADEWAKAREIVRQGLIDQSVLIAQHGRITRIYKSGVLVGDRRRQSPALVLGSVKRLRSKKLLGKPVNLAAAQDYKNCLDLLLLGLPYPDPEATEPVAHPEPQLHNGRGWSPATQREFCEALAELGDVDKACQSIAKSRSVAYEMRNAKGCEAFAIAWDASLLVSTEKLVELAMQLAREGTLEEEARFGKLTGERRILSAESQQATAECVETLELKAARVHVDIVIQSDRMVRVELTPLGGVKTPEVAVETEPVMQAA
jgi:hypothetical protein